MRRRSIACVHDAHGYAQMLRAAALFFLRPITSPLLFRYADYRRHLRVTLLLRHITAYYRHAAYYCCCHVARYLILIFAAAR